MLTLRLVFFFYTFPSSSSFSIQFSSTTYPVSILDLPVIASQLDKESLHMGDIWPFNFMTTSITETPLPSVKKTCI